MKVQNTVTLEIVDSANQENPLTFEVPWFLNMNVQQAMESACLIAEAENKPEFKFGLSYSGQTSKGYGVLGYEVVMINGKDATSTGYWNLSINGVNCNEGIDTCILRPSDTIKFTYKLIG